jgi:phosphoglycerate kinase
VDDKLKYIDELDINNKRVLIRVDFNVPLDEQGNITDDSRIRSVLPTINYALDEDARVILISHFARPNGKRDPEKSLRPVAKRLTRLLKKEVPFAEDCVGSDVRAMVDAMKPGDVLLLENLRFHPEEEDNDDAFGKELGELAEVYINDAFATAHRAHASNIAVTRHVATVGAGFLMKKELTYFARAFDQPIRPLVAIIGGKKVSDKITVLTSLCEKVDKLIIGGGMAMTFFKALGYEIGTSFYEEAAIETAK